MVIQFDGNRLESGTNIDTDSMVKLESRTDTDIDSIARLASGTDDPEYPMPRLKSAKIVLVSYRHWLMSIFLSSEYPRVNFFPFASYCLSLIDNSLRHSILIES